MAYLQYYESETPTYTCTLTGGATDQYPRAIVYNADGTAKENVDLSHVANGQYTGAAAGSYDKGYYMVTIIVYSNSGHTTPNTDYWYGEDTLNVTYKPYGGYGGGGSPEIDWKKLVDNIWKHKTPVKIIKTLERIKKIVSKITNNKVVQAIRDITFPEMPEFPAIPEKVDLQPILAKINEAINEVKNIPKVEFPAIPKPENYDFTLSAIVKMVEEIKKKDQSLEIYNILQELKKNKNILNNLVEIKKLLKKK